MTKQKKLKYNLLSDMKPTNAFEERIRCSHFTVLFDRVYTA